MFILYYVYVYIILEQYYFRLQEMPSDHQVLFGDFNVRTDTKNLVEVTFLFLHLGWS